MAEWQEAEVVTSTPASGGVWKEADVVKPTIEEPLTKKLFPNMPSGGNVSTWMQGAFEAAPAIGSAFGSFPLGLAEGTGAAAGGASLAEATEEMGKSMETYTYKPQTPEAKYIYDNAMKAAGYILEPVSEVAHSIGQMVSTSPYGKVARAIGIPKGATEFLPEQAAFLKLLGKGHAAKKVLSDYYTSPIKTGKVPTTVETPVPVTEKVRRRPTKVVQNLEETQKVRQQQLAERNKDLFKLSEESTKGDTPIVIEDNVPGADLELERQKAIVEGQAEAAGWKAAGVVEPTKVELTGEEAIKLSEEPAKEVKKKGVELSPEDSTLLMDEYGIEGKTHEEVMKLGNDVSAKVAGKGGMDVLDKLTDDEVATLSYRDMVMTPKSARDRQIATIRAGGEKPIDTLTPEKYAQAQAFNKKLQPAIQDALVKQNEKISRSHDVRKTSPDIDDLASEKKVETIKAMSELDRKAADVADRMRKNEDIPDAELDALVLEINKAVEADKTGDTADIFDPLTAYPVAESVMENLPLDTWLQRRKTIEKAVELRRALENRKVAEAKKAIPKTDAEIKKEAVAKRRRDRAALKQLEKESEEAYDLEKREALEEIEGVLDTPEDMVDHIARRTAADKATVKKMKEMSADDYETMLEAEGMPADLNFNESFIRDVGGDIKEAYARAVKWIMDDREASNTAKKAALSYLSSITGRRPKTIVPGALKNALVDAYKYMPETATGARAWLDKVIIPLEEKYLSNKGVKRVAYSRKSIADAVEKKIITKAEADICRIVLDTLKEQPTFELSWDAKLEGKKGLYSFVDNITTLKSPQALAHEIGHYAKHNVISGADRVKFYEDFIDKYYKNNKIQYSRIMDATTDPYNARRNPAEFFATRFSDYLNDKVLSPTERNLFLKVVDWGKKLIAALAKKTGRDYSGVDKIFDKIVDKAGERKVWPGVEEGMERGPISTRTESMLRIIPKDEVIPEVAKGQTIREQRDEWLRNRAGEARRLRGEAEQAVTSMREEQREAYGKGEYESEDKWQGSRAFLERFKEALVPEEKPSTKDVTLEAFGLQTISERLTKMLSDHRKANKITKGQQILAEIQGEGWGEAERSTINVKGVPESSWNEFKDTWKDWLSSPDITAGKGTINDALVYDIRRASMYTAFKVAQHRATIMDAKKGMAGKKGLENRVRVTDYLRRKQRGESVDDMVLSEAELESAGKIREWLDVMRDRYKLYQKTEYSKHLGKTEYNAFLDLEAGYPLDHVKAKYPKISTATVESIYDKYEAINNWGIDDYITNVERGNYRLLVDATTVDGKPYKKLVGVALSEKDGIRKAYEYVKSNPDFSGDMYIDMNMPYGDDLTKVTTKQYHTMKNKLKDSLMKEMEGIEKGVAAKIASATMKRRFKMTPTDVFNQFILDRSDVLKGEPDIFDVLSSYAYHMEKKMALDPAIDKVRLSLNKMTPKEREFILPYLERVKGSYGPFEKMADGLLSLTGMHRPFGRSTAALRNYQAMTKLGYRPIAAAVNLGSGQMHTHVKVGSKYMTKGASFLRTPEGVQFLREVEPYLGTSILETDTSIKAKTPLYHPLGLFQAAEPFNRRMCAAANYQYAISPKIEGGLGLSPDAAIHHAIRQNWFQQFTYDVASLPKAISSPLGRTIGQFKPYLIKEIEFIANLKPKEFARYAAWNMAMAGPRGLLLTIKTLPILAAMGWWQEFMDWSEEQLMKNAPNVARGLPGLPGAPGEIGIDVSGPATFQMPDDMTDLLGVTYSTLSKLYKDVLAPMMAHEYAEDMKHKGGIEEVVKVTSEAAMRFARHEAPAFNHFMRAIDYAIDSNKDGVAYLKDDKGNRLYEIKDAFPYIIQDVMGTESVDISNVRNMVSVAIRRASRDESVEGQIRLEAFREQLAGRPLSDALIAKINKYDINVSSIVDKNIMALLPPGDRQALKTKLRRRGEVLEMFQGLNEDLDDAVSLP